MKVIALGGFLDNYWCYPSIAKDLAPLNPKVIRAPRLGNNWKPEDSTRVISSLDTDNYVIIGFSDGAPVAARVSLEDKRCAGLVFISGFFDQSKITDALSIKPTSLPALFLNTLGESNKLVKGTISGYTFFKKSKANASYRIRKAPETSNPLKRAFPHFHGVAHYAPLIGTWLSTNF